MRKAASFVKMPADWGGSALVGVLASLRVSFHCQKGLLNRTHSAAQKPENRVGEPLSDATRGHVPKAGHVLHHPS